MQVLDLSRLAPLDDLEADLIIIGGGPAGLTIAREFFRHKIQVLVLESGQLQEVPEIARLNAVESVGESLSDVQIQRRSAAHKSYVNSWSHADQPYGVRCRILGGASHVWAGKSASFDPIDFEQRAWVPYSGWPITLGELEPYISRAAERLNLGPNINDDSLWSLIGSTLPEPGLDPETLRSFFWQFARSRTDQFEAMRFGPDFLREPAQENIRVLLNATVTRIKTNASGTVFEGVKIASLAGVRANVRGRVAVIAASGIENARLLLASNQTRNAGIGNEHDVVGRFLLDHPVVQIATFDKRNAATIVKHFGFQGVLHQGRMQMYMHGLALPRSVQEREGLLNCALFMLEEHAHDDPIMALKRLMHGNRTTFARDLVTVLKSPGPVTKGLGIKAFQSDKIPERLKTSLINAIVRINPNFAVREHLHRGVQYKLLGIRVEGISEQCPDPESRVMLSPSKDALGVQRATVSWKVDKIARRSLSRLGQLLGSELSRVGLPPPLLEDWLAQERLDDAPVIDMAHTMGTTRMSDDPRNGVVDANCRVHGVQGLYIAGGSVFPTGGHSNPTLMILALAIRLADHLKAVFEDSGRTTTR